MDDYLSYILKLNNVDLNKEEHEHTSDEDSNVPDREKQDCSTPSTNVEKPHDVNHDVKGSTSSNNEEKGTISLSKEEKQEPQDANTSSDESDNVEDEVGNSPIPIRRQYSLFGVSPPSLTSVMTYEDVPDTTHIKIQSLIINQNIVVDSIKKVNNPYLKLCYKLQKKRCLERNPDLKEGLFFHGTKRANLDQICKYGFDWRKVQAHKYGNGVSFSCNTMYASNYCDGSVNKVMIVAKVFYCKKHIGNELTNFPKEGYDATSKNLSDDVVLVKFEDNTYFPAYVLSFHYRPGYSPHRGSRRLSSTQLWLRLLG